MIGFRHNVKLGAIQPITILIINVVAELMRAYRKDCIIQGLRRCTRPTEDMCHPEGKAVDFRLKHFPNSDRFSLVSAVRSALGDEFTVVHENLGTEYEFLHVQYNDEK